MLTSPPALTDYLGKRIDHFCPFSLGKDNTANHCAHFVSHVMGYDFAEVTCKNSAPGDKQTADKETAKKTGNNGAVIRVNNIFNTATEVGPWNAKPLSLTQCLIFVTISGNMRECGDVLSMDNHPWKHVGFFIDGVVWHYSRKNQVEKDSELIFITKFKHAYIKAGQTVKFFYGRFLK